MLAPIFLLAAAMAQPDVPPVPGLCTAPVPANPETPGCYRTGQIDLTSAPSEIYWQIHEFPTEAAASAEARRHRWASVAQAHSRSWLYVLGGPSEAVGGGTRRAMIGPLKVPAGAVTAHFAEAIFPPGMQTRVHSHPGPEAFYVVEGEQCMESPTDKRLIQAGGTYIVEGGPHLQAAPKGRRNLVLILAPAGQPQIIPGGNWQPTGFCRTGR
ncbi:cupin domain-containing protein [Glacieibacterium frigidum]|uniref:Cupin domain-containing protein n=1 Tax=Glacieibacterium frigidum TaxID=2593303 RepID=A0A552U9L8_9SPHN|nr:hypothetical protein [Glacieibacterium frigidum]TRW14902.1 hypothetical protein FMM06_14645 [Glacieibacterium frigidum]